MDKSELYLAAPEHRECYEGLKKSYDLDKTIFSTYGKVYLLKRSRQDKNEVPSTGSDRGLKKRKTSKDAESTKEEPEFKVTDSDMSQDQEENPGNDDEEPKEKTFDELISTPIDLSAFIMNGLNINKLTQETLLGLAFRLLKGIRSNYAELEYDFEECYKALSEKLDWENPEGSDCMFDLTKPLPLVMSGNRQKVLVDYFFNNDLKYLQGGVLTMTYTTSITKTKAAQYDLLDIKDMVPNIWVPVKVEEMRKHGYGYLREIIVRRADNNLYRFKEGVLQIGTKSMVIENKVETLTITTFSFGQESPPCRYISVPLHFPELTMSSPGHFTSNNEDAFSSNIPDYVSTILDYFHASSGKTYSNALNNSTGEFDELKIKLEKAHSQLFVLQKKQLMPRNESTFTYFRISNLENIIEEIQACHQMNQEDLQNAIHKLKINKDE
nr:hypothetical protein [Tanacetum cinerariifolium]